MTAPPVVSSSALPSSAPLPAPLNPGDFELPAMPLSIGTLPGAGPQGLPVGTAPGEVTLSAQDRAVLMAALGLIRAARADLASPDKAKAAAAKTTLIMTLCHLAGYLDGLGAVRTGSGGSSFAGMLAANSSVNLEDSLDDLEHAVQLALVDTRGGTSALGATLSAVGDALISVGSTVIGASLVL